MKLSTVTDWLDWIAQQHSVQIDLGLDRVKQVAARLDVLSFGCPVVIVGGTNGKGSTVAGLEAIYRASSRNTGVFTSPIIFKHNEMVRINGESVDDQAFCHAYEKIVDALSGVTLTSFEFHTLAALLIVKSYPLDVVILEVGLGGRLDAVNIIDADLSIVTSIGIDHVEYLGDTREAIGFEKAGIFRTNQLAICGDREPPASVLHQANKVGAKLYCAGRDYDYCEEDTTWTFQSTRQTYKELPVATLATDNMANAVMGVTLLQSLLPVTEDAIRQGLEKVKLIGRIQVMREDGKTIIYDVAHNPDSVLRLSQYLKTHAIAGKTFAVFSMLSDKDIVTSIKNIKAQIDHWYVAPLKTERAATKEQLQKAFQEAGVNSIYFYDAIKNALLIAKEQISTQDRIVVFGSFYVLGNMMIHN